MRSSCFSFSVKTACCGTSSCSVKLIISFCSKKLSKIYFGAISSNACFAKFWNNEIFYFSNSFRNRNILTTRSHILLNDNNGAGNVFFLHSLAVNFYLLYSNFRIFRKKHEHLICRVISVTCNDSQIFSAKFLYLLL